jgi:hypothetical protein
MSAPGQQLPKYDELVERIAKLEADRKVTLKDLPMSALMSALENDWRPNAALLLGAPSIASGSATVTYPGGTPISGTTVVQHTLGRTPTAVIATGVGALVVLRVVAVNESTFTVDARTSDGSSPGAGVQDSFNWFAIGAA